jgi:hypothetical protein
MNSILRVKLTFANENNNQKPNERKLRAHSQVTSAKIDRLIEELKSVLRYYNSVPQLLAQCLIDVNYNDIIAKSKRIQDVLKPRRKQTNDCIVGARFSDDPEGQEKHIITYYVNTETIKLTIKELQLTKNFIDKALDGQANADNFNNQGKKLHYEGYGLSKTKLRGIIVDCSAIDSFSVPSVKSAPGSDTFLVTFYKTELRLQTLLEKLGIQEYRYQNSFHGDDTISVTRELYDELNEKVPYLISMISSDLAQIKLDEIEPPKEAEHFEIPEPANEPIIGVIDTLFDESVYFSKWVENIDYLEDVEKYSSKDVQREHGTEVTSIIVDGPRLNPWLDDGCGRFRVKHYGVCVEKITLPRLVRKIREIVRMNSDIHVWNLSLGTEEEVSRNFISFDAAALDEIQSKYNVLFVVSGTNDNRREHADYLKIGSPADSLNSVVVNSVKRDGSPASYSRKGNVLSFFTKPDIAYYGGDYDDRIIAYAPGGKEPVFGTSFAAPWISRKLCYLIDVMGLPREVAKAMLIDAAAGWEFKQDTYRYQDVEGYGVVPIDIRKVLSSENDEIKFIVYGTSESYKTRNYAIPVPRDEDNKYPYVARAALCYFPECNRAQGVDYTSRELSFKLGRINDKDKIDDINDNIQDTTGSYADERQSRKEFRKWENTKFISTLLKGNSRSRKSYGERLWGIEITSKERLSTKVSKHLNFGAVITLKELQGVNRITDFIKACELRGYIVSEIDIQNRINIYNANQEQIRFD